MKRMARPGGDPMPTKPEGSPPPARPDSAVALQKDPDTLAAGGPSGVPLPGEAGADEYLTVAEACRMAKIGRSTFYRLLDDRESGLREVVIRLPVIGHIRVPSRRFRAWLEGKAPQT